MTLIKDKKTGTYKARVKTVEGKTKTLSTKATTKPEAKRVLKQSRLAEIEEAAKAGTLNAVGLTAILAGKKITVEDAINQYRESLVLVGRSENWIHEAASLLRRFATSADVVGIELLKKALNTVTEKMVYDFVNAPGDRNANWRRGQLSILSKFFEFCQIKGWMLRNPAGLVSVRMDLLSHEQKETKPRNPFTDSEVKAILKHTELGTFWHTAVALGRYHGLRLGDIAQLEWATFSVQGKITVWTDKRDRRVSMDLHPTVADAIGAIAPEFGNPYVFPQEREIYKDVRRRANLSTYFRRICESLDVHGKTFHDLRAAFCSYCDRNGIPIEHISRSVGHVSPHTTRGYIKKMD